MEQQRYIAELPKKKFLRNKLTRLYCFDIQLCPGISKLIEAGRWSDADGKRFIICAYPLDVYEDRANILDYLSSEAVKELKMPIRISVLRHLYWEIPKGSWSKNQDIAWLLPPTPDRLPPAFAKIPFFVNEITRIMTERQVFDAQDKKNFALQEELNRGSSLQKSLELIKSFVDITEKWQKKTEKKTEVEDNII